jgi:hypothetical protein
MGTRRKSVRSANCGVETAVGSRSKLKTVPCIARDRGMSRSRSVTLLVWPYIWVVANCAIWLTAPESKHPSSNYQRKERAGQCH